MSKLNVLDAWKNGVSNFFGGRSAQGYLNRPAFAMASSGSCGSACGAGDKDEKKEEKPSACGSACGAGDKDEKKEEKPSACGSACGAGDKEKK
jgi:ACGX-repeat protein